MATFYDRLNDELTAFISRQPLFFTGTAASDGRVNVSPKGMDALRCLDERTVAYLDVTGSGNETAAHLSVSSRMTLMFCSFTREPLILRLYGSGRIVERGADEWRRLIDGFPALPGARQIVVLHIDSVQTSCGYAVPRMDFVKERDTLKKWAASKGDAALEAYRREKNARSIDGIAVAPWAHEADSARNG